MLKVSMGNSILLFGRDCTQFLLKSIILHPEMSTGTSLVISWDGSCTASNNGVHFFTTSATCFIIDTVVT